MPDCRVLVVEDDQDTRESLIELLRFEDYEAEGAPDGQSALQLLRGGTFKPDVIVVDLYMPTMDGQQFRTALQAEKEFAHVPVIVCTGSTPITSAPPVAFEVLQKPLDVDALLAVVQRGCASRAAKDRALSA